MIRIQRSLMGGLAAVSLSLAPGARAAGAPASDAGAAKAAGNDLSLDLSAKPAGKPDAKADAKAAAKEKAATTKSEAKSAASAAKSAATDAKSAATDAKAAAVDAKAAAGNAKSAEAASKALDKDAAVPTHQKHPLDANPPAPKGDKVELKIGDQSALAYVAKPKGEPKGSVLVIHEYWGLNDWIRHEADELAALGYVALAVDLYKGQVATNPDDAGKLMGGMDKEWAAKVEHAGINWLKEKTPRHDLGVIGWCMGGGQSLQASLANPGDVAATVIYYGLPESDPTIVARLKGGSVLGIFAKKDGWITPDKVEAFEKALTAAGVQHEIASYDADHAFANPSGGRHNPEAAKDAWKKTTAFLAAHLN